MGQNLTFKSSPRVSLEEETVQEFDDFVMDMKNIFLDSEEYANIALERMDGLIWRNPDIPEVHEVAEVVEDFVSMVVERLQLCEGRLKFGLVRSGSYYEGLRVGLPYEFDYMLELEPIHLSLVTVSDTRPRKYMLYTNDEIFKTRKFSKAGIKFYPLITDNDAEEKGKQPGVGTTSSCSDSEVNHNLEEDDTGWAVDSFVLRVHVYDELQSIVSMFYNTPYKGLTILESAFIKDNKPNFCVKMLYKDVGVMVDLVPCIKFPSVFSDILPEIPANVEKLFSVYIPESRESVRDYVAGMLYFVSSNYGWRLSYSKVEQAILQGFPCEAKRALRVLKYIGCTFFPVTDNYTSESLHKFGYKSVIESYSLKCLFLSSMVQVHDSEHQRLCRGAYLTFMKLLYNCSFFTKDSSSMLVFKNKDVFFSDDFKATFTVIEKSECYSILQMVGHLLRQCMADNNWDRFRLVNYPNIHNVKLAPSHFNR